MIQVIIALVGGIFLGAGIVLFVKKGSNTGQEEMSENLKQNLQEIIPIALSQANDELIKMANEKLGAESKQGKVDLENKRGEIERLVKTIQTDLKASKKELEMSEKERISSFSALRNSLEEYKKVTEQLSVSTESLKKVLSNNQLRGQFGEQVADELLKMAGFVRGVDYEFNKEQAGSETRPDFAVFLPDGTRINVDSKFPYANLQRMSETDSEDAKKQYKALFEKDVKEKIKQVTTRDYINPDDRTVDFVILFIPNEMIFSYIYDKLPEVWQSAMAQKVILAGPFSFTAILRMVRQSYENFRVQKNIYDIIGHVKAFEKEFVTFSDSFYKIGDRLNALQKQYDTVSTTRFNQMVRRIDKVKQEGSEIEDEKKDQKTLDL